MNKTKIFSLIFATLSILLMSFCASANNTIVDPLNVLSVEVKQNDRSYIAVDEVEAKMLIAYVNATKYSNILNDGRMMKMAPNDYSVSIKLKSGEQMIIQIWKLTLLKTNGKWYNIDTDILGYKLSDIKKILDKYSQNNAVTTDKKHGNQ